MLECLHYLAEGLSEHLNENYQGRQMEIYGQMMQPAQLPNLNLFISSSEIA
jgi:hypothetical protein